MSPTGASAAPKKRKGSEDDLAFDEEVDEYEGLNAWQKYLKWYRKQYGKFANWRKKAARIKYWMGVAKLIQNKIGKYMAIGVGLLAIGGGQFAALKGRWNAEEKAAREAEAHVVTALLAERQ